MLCSANIARSALSVWDVAPQGIVQQAKVKAQPVSPAAWTSRVVLPRRFPSACKGADETETMAR
jgi:hypothetical protein